MQYFTWTKTLQRPVLQTAASESPNVHATAVDEAPALRRKLRSCFEAHLGRVEGLHRALGFKDMSRDEPCLARAWHRHDPTMTCGCSDSISSCRR